MPRPLLNTTISHSRRLEAETSCVHARRAIVGALVGATLGSVTYWAQAPPPAGAHPSLSARRARLLALGLGAVLFGLYHIAHSPPSNSAAMVGLLTGVGIVTGVFYVVSGDVHGTVVFHNFLAPFGVLDAMERAGRPAHFTLLQAPLVVMALATLMVMLALHGAVRRARARTTSPG